MSNEKYPAHFALSIFPQTCQTSLSLVMYSGTRLAHCSVFLVQRKISGAFRAYSLFNIKTHSTKTLLLLRKEVIQPHLPIRLPCYDFTPVIGFALGSIFPADFGHPQLPWCDGRCVQDPGTHSPRHSDPRLLATPTSCRRVAAYNPNWDRF